VAVASWHQLGNMQVCIALQTDNHASTPQLSSLLMPFLPPNQQYQSTEGSNTYIENDANFADVIFLGQCINRLHL